MSDIVLGISIVSFLIWVYLLAFRGQFWRMDQRLPTGEIQSASVCVVIPARNEADMLPLTLRSLLTQDFSGSLTIFLVDDHSTDGTAQIARSTAEECNQSARLQIIPAQPLPSGWTGKLWAVQQGIERAIELKPDYILLTDADIQHDSGNVRDLVSWAMADDRELVSLMVRLRCVSIWEKLLIPAFVFFFAKLYPFRWANDPTRTLAAAAGGCSLIRREALERIGGMYAIRQALIDDCALADAIKASGTRRIWLGLTRSTISLRPYDSLDTIWKMVARTAYTQLNYSPILLVGSVLGMGLVYLAPILVLNWIGLLTYVLMSIAYFPIVRFYRCPAWSAFCLPAIAFLYTLMTIDSALQHWQGKGGAWKGRTYGT
ncbi:glycosyltransferase [Leptolyngbya sp. GGD]|uniref:glycosyltransferase n=1 Tax=Leptolyngbya sp. GGD TaxID=2997907 RepID=UPI00227B628C|nr:glycosyltransferase [Leptolyngbya sp. GGD]MCY6490675.1 glycosyltransferase [Leptolyngbya sp. GGD]